MRCYFKNTYARTRRSVVTRLKGNREVRTVLNFFFVATHFSPGIQRSILRSGFNQNRSTCIRVLLLKISGFVSCVKTPSSKISENFPHSRYISLFKLNFLSSSRFEFFIPNPFESFTPKEEVSIGNNWFWSSHKNLDSPKFPDSCY